LPLRIEMADESRWFRHITRVRARARGKSLVVRADEKLTAFLELESAIQAHQKT
jgi:hypothetical protein